MNTQYVPMLKARAAELEALHGKPSSLQITPYFELQKSSPATIDPVTGALRRAKSSVTDASYFFDDLARLWSNELYLDISRVAASSERPQWWQFISTLTALFPSVKVIPALDAADSSTTWSAAAPIAAQIGRAAVRFAMPHTTPGTFGTVVNSAAQHLGLPASQIDVVLDWGDSMEATSITLDSLEAHSIAAINGLGQNHGSIITAGTPNSAAFVQAGYWTVTRREWWLWLRLNTSAPTPVIYGDYALYPPADPVPAGPKYGHLRYSNSDQLHVHRKSIPKSGGGLAAAFKLCCIDLVGAAHYLGNRFSRADAYFDQVSRGTLAQGQAGTWRQWATIHHFALVANQLQSPPPPPAAGTL